MSEKKPWLNYERQTAQELLELSKTHRVDSVVCAFEEALQKKREMEGNDNITEEEHVILAIEAFEREVNNGGHHQFLLNSSREFAVIVVRALKQIDCPSAAKITADAFASIGLPENPSLSEVDSFFMNQRADSISTLYQFDRQFYKNRNEIISDKLFAFIEKNLEMISWKVAT